MDQHQRATIDFELTALQVNIGKVFNDFVVGKTLSEPPELKKIKNTAEVSYRLQRLTDLIFDMLCYQFAVIRFNGGSVQEVDIKGLVSSIMSETERLYQNMLKEKEKYKKDKKDG
jgi:hypothetical protein